MDTQDLSLIAALDAIADKLGGGLPLVPQAAYTDDREELLVLYSVCDGIFHEGPVITITGTLHSLDGAKVGTWAGVDQPAGPDSLPAAFQDPPRPTPPFDSPNHTVVREIPVLSWSKGIWRFDDDGSTITALGPAQLRAMIWKNTGQGQLWVSGEQIVTGGTGRYAGVQGVKTVSGTSWIPPGPNGGPPNFTQLGQFPARVIDVFRLVRAENIGNPPPLPGA
jgi:hypothetical protein